MTAARGAHSQAAGRPRPAKPPGDAPAGTSGTTVRRLLDRWLFRLHSPEPAPIVLRQRRIFVLPSAAGMGFAAALATMLIASINYNLSLGYAVTFLLAGIGIASVFHAFRDLLHLEIRTGRADPVFCGAPAEFHLLVTNTRGARRPALRLEAHGARVTFDIAADDTADVVLACPATRRGWQPLGRVVLETTWPLGFVRAWSVLVPDSRCLVYPRPESDPPPLPESRAEAPGARRGPGGDDDFGGLRAHRSTDSPRHVAWKVLARGGPMLTKQFAGTAAGELALDWHELPAHLDDEARLSRLAAWILAADARGQAFSLALPSRSLPLGNGPAHREACLRLLALHGIAHERS